MESFKDFDKEVDAKKKSSFLVQPAPVVSNG